MQVNHHLVELAARVSAFIRSLDEQLATIAQTEATFDRIALDLFALQFKYNPPYRRLCEARGQSPKTIEHWSQIPAVPASGFKEHEFSCLPPDQRTAVFHSSGTTQQRPSRHFHSPESLGLYEQSLWPWFVFRVFPEWTQAPLAVAGSNTQSRKKNGIRFLSLTPPPNAAPHSSLVHMFGTIHRRLGSPGTGFTGRVAADGTWEFHPEEVSKLLMAAVAKGEPMLVLGTAFLFVHLLDYVSECGGSFVLPEGSRALETGGYKGRSRKMPKEELYTEITRSLGIPNRQIICEYGMSELSSQAYSKANTSSKVGPPGREPFAFPPWARARVISPETGREVAEGETGLLRILDLANVFSVLAIQTEDLAIRRGEEFELLGRAATAEPRGCSLMAAQ